MGTESTTDVDFTKVDGPENFGIRHLIEENAPVEPVTRDDLIPVPADPSRGAAEGGVLLGTSDTPYDLI